MALSGTPPAARHAAPLIVPMNSWAPAGRVTLSRPIPRKTARSRILCAIMTRQILSSSRFFREERRAGRPPSYQRRLALDGAQLNRVSICDGLAVSAGSGRRRHIASPSGGSWPPRSIAGTAIAIVMSAPSPMPGAIFRRPSRFRHGTKNKTAGPGRREIEKSSLLKRNRSTRTRARSLYNPIQNTV